MSNIIRYNVHRSLGGGGAKVGQFDTLAEAKAFVGNKDMRILKTWYCKSASGTYRIAHQVEV